MKGNKAKDEIYEGGDDEEENDNIRNRLGEEELD